MSESSADLFNRAEDGTAYWTLSIYIKSELLDNLRPEKAVNDIGSAMRRAQLGHLPSMALRNAIDPLFNDIADRDFFGKPRDFLFAAGLGQEDPDTRAAWASPKVARDALLDERKIVMTMPNPIEWTTEGIIFKCHLPTNAPRELDLRRFWFAHSDGALSYHLSFAHDYKRHRANTFPANDYADVESEKKAREKAAKFDVETYYFLSLLQKLAAPKEFSLSDDLLRQLVDRSNNAAATSTGFDEPPEGSGFSVFAKDAYGRSLDLGIAPLDGMLIAEREKGDAPRKFWPYVQDLFVGDAETLFADVFGWPVQHLDCSKRRRDVYAALLKPVDVLEVPGLKMPRCRYMLHIHDKMLFDRLLPHDPVTGEALPRKRMVRDQCFKPYQMAMSTLMRPGPGNKPADTVHLGTPGDASLPHFPWNRLDMTADYESALGSPGSGGPVFFTDEDGNPVTDLNLLERRIQAGSVWQHHEVSKLGPQCDPIGAKPCEEPQRLHIPAYVRGRSDCLDYLFLSGFNQNIIDWLNQDTSEILDSLDPIYPTEALEEDERFFVRYANHRGMLTYVARSRSLEIGNDYIGTCPYAFLIHVLAMHNEFLARDHERRTASAIATINAEVDALGIVSRTVSKRKDGRDSVVPNVAALSGKIEDDINRLKRDSYQKYERHRYLNIFRYNTEGDVFKKMAELRGTDWRGQAMDKALETLEEYAADIDRRNREEQKKVEDKRASRLNLMLQTVGGVSAVSVFFSMAEFVKGRHFGMNAGEEGWTAFWLGNGGMALAIAGIIYLLLQLIMRRRDVARAVADPLLDQDRDASSTIP